METAMESRPSAESGGLVMQEYLGTDCFALYLSGVSLFLICTYKCLFCFSNAITIDGNMNSEVFQG